MRLTREQFKEIQGQNLLDADPVTLAKIAYALREHAEATFDGEPAELIINDRAIITRTEIAMGIHSALVSNSWWLETAQQACKELELTSDNSASYIAATCAKVATRHADALIAELTKK